MVSLRFAPRTPGGFARIRNKEQLRETHLFQFHFGKLCYQVETLALLAVRTLERFADALIDRVVHVPSATIISFGVTWNLAKACDQAKPIGQRWFMAARSRRCMGGTICSRMCHIVRHEKPPHQRVSLSVEKVQNSFTVLGVNVWNFPAPCRNRRPTAPPESEEGEIARALEKCMEKSRFENEPLVDRFFFQIPAGCGIFSDSGRVREIPYIYRKNCMLALFGIIVSGFLPKHAGVVACTFLNIQNIRATVPFFILDNYRKLLNSSSLW